MVVSTGAPRSYSRLFLLALLGAIALALLDSLWFSIRLFRAYPHSLFMFSAVWLLLSPLMYLYAAFYLKKKKRLEWLDLLHALPALVYLWLVVDFFVLPAERKVAIGNALIEGNSGPSLFSLLFFGQSYVYLVLAYRLLKGSGYRWLFQWWLFWVGVVVFDGFTCSPA